MLPDPLLPFLVVTVSCMDIRERPKTIGNQFQVILLLALKNKEWLHVLFFNLNIELVLDPQL